MNKLKTFIIIGLFAIAGVLGYILLTQTDKGQNAQTIADRSAGDKTSFSQFIKENTGPYKCEVKQTVDELESTGTIYLADGRIRGDFNTTLDKEKMQTAFIMKDGYSYNWSDTLSFGAKVKVNTNIDKKSEAEASGTYTWNTDRIGEYDCTPWQTDESLFVIPTNIEFTEL